MTSTANRRWPRFSLRTLFVVATVMGCWLGYQLNWIRQRHGLITREESLRRRIFPSPEDAFSMHWTTIDGINNRSAPRVIGIFGERGSALVRILAEDLSSRNELTARDQKRLGEARRLFPEADIELVHENATAIEELVVDGAVNAQETPIR